MTVIRTVERNYPASRETRSGRVSRVHIVREEGPRGHEGPKRQTWCGQHAYDVTNSRSLIREAPHPLPEGLRWCPACIGHLAEQVGRLGEVARLLGAEGGTAATHSAEEVCTKP